MPHLLVQHSSFLQSRAHFLDPASVIVCTHARSHPCSLCQEGREIRIQRPEEAEDGAIQVRTFGLAGAISNAKQKNDS